MLQRIVAALVGIFVVSLPFQTTSVADPQLERKLVQGSDEALIDYLKSIREDHMKMQTQISVNTQHLHEIERRLEQHEQQQLNSSVPERMAAVETKVNIMLWVGAVTAAAVIGDLIRRLLREKRLDEMAYGTLSRRRHHHEEPNEAENAESD